MELVNQLRSAAGGGNAAISELLIAAADQIEWLNIVLQEIADRNRCTCEPSHYEIKRSAPECRAHLAGDDAREALGQDIECLGRLVRRKPLSSYN